VLVRRDTRAKEAVPLAGAASRLAELMGSMQKDLLEKARAFVAANTTRIGSYEEFKQAMAEKRGFIVAGWNGDPAVEARIKEETKATIRVMPLGDPIEATCVYTGQKGREVYFAQAY
jgi:prolyl-tRNA synthetase